MLRDILIVLWVFVPAGVANMVPVLAARLPLIRSYDAPVDAGRTFRGRRILGDHKTWRGFATGIVAATLVLWLQQFLVSCVPVAAWLAGDLDYANLPVLLIGPLFGIGALGGDAVKSFFKRQLDITPGRSWFPFDQIDYIVGGALAVLPFIRFTFRQYILLVAVWLLTHLIASYIGYLLSLKDQPI